MAPDPTAAPRAGQQSRANIANTLTVLRLALVPVFLGLFFGSGGRTASLLFASAAVFVLAAATDRVDGELARRRGLVTEFGKAADPIADKALTGSALLALSATGTLAWWVTATILARELGVTVLRLLVIRHGVIPASRGGKAKTTVQVLTITVYLLPLAALPYSAAVDVARSWLAVAAVAVTVGTALDYVAQAVRLSRERKRAPATPERER